MPDNIPETGDVVIHSSGSHETQSFAIRAVPGPDKRASSVKPLGPSENHRSTPERLAQLRAIRSASPRVAQPN